MKKVLTIALAVLLVLATFVSCGKQDDASSSGNDTTAAAYKLGMGVEVAYENEQTGSASVEATVAAVVLDKDGKIVSCKIDCVAPEVKTEEGFLEDGAIEKAFTSKYDLGDNYNMVAYGNAKAEWYAQADAFAKYCVGKTADDVSAIALGEDGKPTDADLTAGCTIAASDFVKAVVKACKDEQAKSFEGSNIKLGLHADGYVEEANDSEDNNGKVKFSVEFAASVVGADGKLVAAVIDAAQPEFAFDDTGAVTEAKYSDTKRGLKENYNMVTYGNAIAEWYKQAASLTDKIAGKTADEIKAIPLDSNGKTTDADLLAVCTIAVSGDIENVTAAMAKAK